MRVVLQRVAKSDVIINNAETRSIGRGLLILLGIEEVDNYEDIQWLVRKIVNLRIFQDDQDKMNLSLLDVQGDLLVISQFTLHASTKKGNRPSFIKAAKPDHAIPLYERFVQELKSNTTAKIETGEFGAEMQVSLINDGPVTITIDSQNKE